MNKTTDMDFLIHNLRQPKNPVDIVSLAVDKGYSYKEDYITRCSRLKKDDFTIEFLICQKGDGTKNLPRTHIGINAQQITHMEIALKYNTQVSFKEHFVIIPIPEAYVLQKMIINDKRSPEKKIADQGKITNLLNYIDINKLDYIYQTLYKKEKIKVHDYIEKHHDILKIKNGHIIPLEYKQLYLEKENIASDMKNEWYKYFRLPDNKKQGFIEWKNTKYPIAVFTDMYLGQCQKEQIEFDSKIYNYFTKTCIEWKEYKPQHFKIDKKI